LDPEIPRENRRVLRAENALKNQSRGMGVFRRKVRRAFRQPLLLKFMRELRFAKVR
jgi:hypothetical protein